MKKIIIKTIIIITILFIFSIGGDKMPTVIALVSENITNATINQQTWKSTTYNAPVRLSKLPGFGNSTYGFNSQSFIQDNLTTFGTTQYAIWVNDVKKPIIGKRTLPNGEWSTFDLSTVAGNPLASPVANDLHNVLTVAVDSDGYIHVTGNHHNNPLRYIRSLSPNDITTWEIPNMTGVNEDALTYPTFVKLRNDTLLFFYRNGVSGYGNYYINEYNTTTKTWSKKQTLFIDGVTSNENAYLNHIAVDVNNIIHIMFVWRGTGLANTNNDICYAKSLDGGGSWQKSDGTVYTLPITHATAEKVVDTADTDSGLINQNGLEVDNLGRPHGAFFLYDGSGYTQIHHIWHDGSVWHNDTVTNFSYRYETNVSILDGTVARPSVFCTKDGRVYIIYRHQYENKRGTVRMIDVTPDVPYYDDFDIMQLDLHDWEATFDTQALYNRNELHMMIIPSKNIGSASIEYNSDDNWDSQYIAVITYDLNQMDVIQRGEIPKPYIETISVINNPTTALTITATTFTDLAQGAILVLPDLRGDILFVKLKTRADLTGGATLLQLRIKEVDEASSTTFYYGTLSLTAANRIYTPWIPLRVHSSTSTGFLTNQAKVDVNSGRITIFGLDLGRLVLK